jgi:thymidine phosphorylase
LSKKLAAGLQGLCLDVKFGAGAFMPEPEAARALAASLVEVANGAGLPTRALLTDMNEPLAPVAGNALEVAFVVDYLTGRRAAPRFHEVTVALGAQMLVLGGLAADAAEGAERVDKALKSGRAAEIFGRMVAALGGPSDLIGPGGRIPTKTEVEYDVQPDRIGIVQSIDARAIGMGVVALGGGRSHPDQRIDPAVGFTDLAGIGERVDDQRPLGTVHARDDGSAKAAAATLRAAYRIGDSPAAPGPLILQSL